METLKKEQIMPYMSYRLKMCERITRFNKKTLEEYEMSYGEGEIFSYIGSKTPYVVWDNGRGKTQETFMNDFNSEKGYMLILRPLSDLTKEIEHNGQKGGDVFIPARILMCPEFKFCDDREDLLFDLQSPESIQRCPYNVVQKLLEWRFNVFNLPSHLWIDVNTLEENPYK